MKRDMDLVRKILIALNDYPHGNAPNNFSIEGYSQETVAYHCFILDEAGLIEAADTTASDSKSPEAIPNRITWSGHEFVENARNDQVWKQTKNAVAKVGEASFSVWTSVLSNVVIKNLGLS